MTLGEFVRAKRLDLELSLRQFCQKLSIDSSNWSKVERGTLALTLSEEKLEEMVSILKLVKKNGERQKFYDLVTLARKEIPDVVYTDKEILDALPVLFRAASGERPTKEQREQIIDLIKNR